MKFQDKLYDLYIWQTKLKFGQTKKLPQTIWIQQIGKNKSSK